MKSGDGSARHGNKHIRPNRQSFRMAVAESYLRDSVSPGQQSGDNTKGHHQQGEPENRVQLSDYLIYGQKGCQNIVSQNHRCPECHSYAFRGKLRQQSRRACDKHRSYQQKQQHRKYTHYVLRTAAQIYACQFCN